MKIVLVVLVFPGRAATVAAVTGDGDQATAGKSRENQGSENQGSRESRVRYRLESQAFSC